MTFERGGELYKCDGEAGYGVYAYVTPNIQMRQYYTANGEKLYKIKPLCNARFIDFTKRDNQSDLLIYMQKRVAENKLKMAHYVVPKINRSNFQRFGTMIEDFVRITYGNADGWIVPHKGVRIPTGKQVVITNLNSVEVQEY